MIGHLILLILIDWYNHIKTNEEFRNLNHKIIFSFILFRNKMKILFLDKISFCKTDLFNQICQVTKSLLNINILCGFVVFLWLKLLLYEKGNFVRITKFFKEVYKDVTFFFILAAMIKDVNTLIWQLWAKILNLCSELLILNFGNHLHSLRSVVVPGFIS